MNRRDDDSDDPKLEIPLKTAVDDFLLVSTKKVSKGFSRPSGSRIRGAASHSGNRDSSSVSSTRSCISKKPNASAKQSLATMVSPLQTPSASMKAKMNRKTLNKLKRKRLEENTTHIQSNISFSSNLIPCLFKPMSTEGRMAINYLRLGTLFAKTIISLNPNSSMRWPLMNNQSDIEPRKEPVSNNPLPKENIFTFPRDFNGLLNSSENRNPSFILSTNDDSSKPLMPIESIANMMKAMNAGILFTGSNNYQFLLVPHEVSGTLSGLACIWDNVNQVQQHDMDQIHAGEMESQHADNDHVPKKKKSKIPNFHPAADLQASKQTTMDVDENMLDSRDVEFEPLQWNDLLLQYENCISQEEGSLSPVTFARENVRAAVTTFWNGCQGQGDKTNNIQALFNLLRQPIDEAEKGICLLQSQSELATMLQARPKESSNDRNPTIGEEQAPTKQNEFVLLIIVQILIRIQLFAMCNGDSTERNVFLQNFSLLDTRNAPTKKYKKRQKKQKPYTVQNFMSEVCSLAEKLSFILPSPGSFAAFLTEQVLTPFLPIAPDLIADIAAFFELDLSGSEDAIETVLADEDSENEQEIDKNMNVCSPSRHSNSRWSKSILRKEMGLAEKDAPALSSTEIVTKLPEAEDKVLFKNKIDLTVKTNRTNPLLAGSKGRYIGRQFSGNYFREVKVTKLVPATKKTRAHSDQKPEKRIPQSFVTTVSETPQGKPRRTMSLGLATRLGASSLSFRNKPLTRRSSMFVTSTKSKSNKDMPPPKAKHPHAAVLAALVAMRKKR